MEARTSSLDNLVDNKLVENLKNYFYTKSDSILYKFSKENEKLD